MNDSAARRSLTPMQLLAATELRAQMREVIADSDLPLDARRDMTSKFESRPWFTLDEVRVAISKEIEHLRDAPVGYRDQIVGWYIRHDIAPTSAQIDSLAGHFASMRLPHAHVLRMLDLVLETSQAGAPRRTSARQCDLEKTIIYRQTNVDSGAPGAPQRASRD